MSYDTAKPYIASYVIVHKNGKIASVLRSNTGWMDGFYGLPAGKVEKDEQFSTAAIREALEEVGIKVAPNDLKFIHVMHRRAETDWVDIFFQAAKWEGEPTNAEPDVHSEVAWLDLNDLPENVIPAVRYALEQIEAGKTYSEFGWDEP